MPFTFTLPKLSPTMEEGTIVKWHKKEGEFVEAGAVLLEIATDKATVEHSALDEGWLRKILVPEGKVATINQPIAIFTEKENESIEGYQLPPPAAPQKTVSPEVKVEKEGEKISPPQAPLSQPAFVPQEPLPYEPAPTPEGKIKASPLAKKLAKQQGLDLSTVSGSGPGGRITSRDLKRAQPLGLVTFGRKETPKEAPGSYREIPLSPMRKMIARRLQESKSFIPHFYVKQLIDATPLVALREQLKTFNLHITFNDMILRACALALREHPEVNSGFNSVNQTVIQFKTIDISVAVTLEAGLITPIIRHADYKNLGQISTEMRALGERARAMKLQEHEYKGGSFCLSNLGMFGITAFTAVINPPQSAILAVGAIQEMAMVKGGKVEVGKSLELNLSADHRVIDGSLAAQFIKTLQRILENPVSLTL
jgi:pyruvate dehydrogenase E2 component (dihydrolipoamide acetyltransferase)